MLKALREYLDQQLRAAPGERDSRESARIAAAALWLEMVRTDGRTEAAERAAVLHGVRSRFDLTEQQALALVESAESAAARATDDFEFTSLINRHFAPQEKELVIEQLWRVAFADGELSAYEEHFVRRIAELIYVSHAAYIAAKSRAAKQAHERENGDEGSGVRPARGEGSSEE
jgi:uncharacterized tellurite resistance protein B-like protein